MLSVVCADCHIETHHPECCYAERRYAKWHYTESHGPAVQWFQKTPAYFILLVN
jgi:hypothetical protein